VPSENARRWRVRFFAAAGCLTEPEEFEVLDEMRERSMDDVAGEESAEK
jgi:hypothetical protein